jgi:hypothetical protein
MYCEQTIRIVRLCLEAVIDVMKEKYAASQSAGGAGGGASGSGGDGSASGVAGSSVTDTLLPMLDAMPERFLQLVASPDGKGVLLDLCSCFVSTAVGVYIDKTAGGPNSFDDFFGAAARPANLEVGKRMSTLIDTCLESACVIAPV